MIGDGTCLDILYLLPEREEKLIIVDAVMGGGEPGSIYRFTPMQSSSEEERLHRFINSA